MSCFREAVGWRAVSFWLSLCFLATVASDIAASARSLPVALRLRGGRACSNPGASTDTDSTTRKWSCLEATDKDGDDLTLFVYSSRQRRGDESCRVNGNDCQLMLEVDHQYSDGGFTMCLGPIADCLPPVLILGNENKLQPHEGGFASGSQALDLFFGRLEGSPLHAHAFAQSRLGDWDTFFSGSGNSACVEMHNRFFGSKLLLANSGIAVWLSNHFGNKSLVVESQHPGAISELCLADGKTVWDLVKAGSVAAAQDLLRSPSVGHVHMQGNPL